MLVFSKIQISASWYIFANSGHAFSQLFLLSTSMVSSDWIKADIAVTACKKTNAVRVSLSIHLKRPKTTEVVDVAVNIL